MYELSHAPSEDSLQGNGVGRVENRLVVTSCFLIGRVDGSGFLLVHLPCFNLKSGGRSRFPGLEGRLFFHNVWLDWDLLSCK